MRVPGWSTRQHLAALGLLGVLFLLTQASNAGFLLFGWLQGFFRILEGFPLRLVWQSAEYDSGYLILGAFLYYMFNANYFMGVKSHVLLRSQGEDRPPLVLMPFLHPYSPAGTWVDRHFSRHKLGIQCSAWPRFYFVTLGFFSLAQLFALILAVYEYSPQSFPLDLFSAWGLAFQHWSQVMNLATRGGVEFVGIAIAYFYWRHGAPLVSELLLKAGFGPLFRGCWAEYSGRVEDLFEEQVGLSELGTVLATNPLFQHLPFNVFHRKE